ncbi:hypothetical protein, partial [Acidiphilium sp.]|uniref:hypothetical protein n=1 Tax=Acidiphilium sp. TaxID=527 RepID=UPI003D06C3FF
APKTILQQILKPPPASIAALHPEPMDPVLDAACRAMIEQAEAWARGDAAAAAQAVEAMRTPQPRHQRTRLPRIEPAAFHQMLTTLNQRIETIAKGGR